MAPGRRWCFDCRAPVKEKAVETHLAWILMSVFSAVIGAFVAKAVPAGIHNRCFGVEAMSVIK